MNQIILVTGGCRSGKSAFAEYLCSGLISDKKNKIAYIATAEAVDNEFTKRIKLHQQRRGDDFVTYEENFNPDKLLNDIYHKYNIFLFECISTWLGNILYHHKEIAEIQILEIVKNFCRIFSPQKNCQPATQKKVWDQVLSGELIHNDLHQNKFEKSLVIVSSETGLGLVPGDVASRQYRDLLGNINQQIGVFADKIYFTVAGVPCQLK